jgi:hypothetical protein
MNRQHMQKRVDDLNQDEEVENARVVEFMGNPHIHVDLADGDSEVITQEGESRFIPIHYS